MATQPQRLERIARIIQAEPIFSQQELQSRLRKAGVTATQATLSRDLQRLGVLKGPSGYLLPGASGGLGGPGATQGSAADEELARRALRRELRALDVTGNLIVIRTDSGHANALAIELDRARPTEIVGTIAGDDTIFLAAHSPSAASRFAKRLRSLAAGD